MYSSITILKASCPIIIDLINETIDHNNRLFISMHGNVSECIWIFPYELETWTCVSNVLLWLATYTN